MIIKTGFSKTRPITKFTLAKVNMVISSFFIFNDEHRFVSKKGEKVRKWPFTWKTSLSSRYLKTVMLEERRSSISDSEMPF